MKRTTVILNLENIEKLVTVLGEEIRKVSDTKWVNESLVIEYDEGKIRVFETSKGGNYSPEPGVYVDVPKGKEYVNTFETFYELL